MEMELTRLFFTLFMLMEWSNFPLLY